LDTTIDWKNTADNSYDGEKLLMLVHDECYDPETNILMSDFKFKKIKDINIGDKVIVEGGIIKTVVKKTSGITEKYLVSQPYAKDYVVTKNHRLLFNSYGKGEVIMTPEEYIN
ncbi:MAG: Hint domain-containing homing endonuclease, partial [bacterium]